MNSLLHPGKLHALLMQAPSAIAVVNGPRHQFQFANPLYQQLFGKTEAQLLGNGIREVWPEAGHQAVFTLFDTVLSSGEAFHTDRFAGIAGYYSFTIQPVRDEEGTITELMVIANDVTSIVNGQVKVEENEARLNSMFSQSPYSFAILKGEDLIITLANKTTKQLWGKGDEIEGHPLEETMPELVAQGWPQLLRQVMQSGEPFYADEAKVSLLKAGEPYEAYYNFVVQPYEEGAGNITGVALFGNEVTAQAVAGQRIRESEQRLRSVVDSTPFPIGVYSGKEMRIAYANRNIMDVWGKGHDVVGKLYAEILPELANQEIYEQLDQVYTSGQPFHNRNQRLELVVDGTVQPFYFNYSFTPLFDTDGVVYGVLNTAADVTDSNLAAVKLLEAQNSLKDVIEMAELATWSIDLVNLKMEYSGRLREWSGYGPDETIDMTETSTHIKASDIDAIRNSMLAALDPALNRPYDAEYTITNRITGAEHIVHAHGRAIFDDEGKAVRVSGSAQDVTVQRETQMALERLVQLRTEELGASNEELRTTVEELALSNDRLLHSNEELQQYAYVASHDLQEPLRKIRMFSGLLDGRGTLPDTDKQLVTKITQSAERMHMLIRDLLDFSKLLKSDDLMRPVDLWQVMLSVANDFELAVQEKSARLNIGKLPVIEAVGLQMNQLFYNLMGNALKFVAPGREPVVTVHAVAITQEEAGAYIPNPLPSTNYYRITVGDNGIGIESAYTQQIFDVFKRLHGRESYPGSGIGLALCRRIVTNHHGALYVESEEGAGSAFHIILPDRQRC